MVDFNGFDKGVIGKKLPADTTLNCMRKSELIDLLHLAESNHRVLAEAYKIAVDTSKCNLCPLHLDTKKAEDIRADERRKFAEWLHENVLIDVESGVTVVAEVEYTRVITFIELLKMYEKEQKGDRT